MALDFDFAVQKFNSDGTEIFIHSVFGSTNGIRVGKFNLFP